MNNIYFSLKKYRSTYDYIPLIIVLSYLNITYSFHLFLSKSPSVYGLIFMSSINLSIIVGYFLPNKTNTWQLPTSLKVIWKKKINVNRIIILSSIITIISSINVISTFYPDSNEILFYLKNPGKAYIHTKFMKNNVDDFAKIGGFGSIIGILLTLLSATKYVFITFSILYWDQLKKRTITISILTFIIYCISSFLVGAMITIGSIIMACVPIFIVKMKQQKRSFNFFSQRLKYLIIVGLGVLIVVFFMSNRVSDDNNFREGINVLAFYVSHGYEGLDYCLELPFKPTYGFTSFKGVSEMFVKYLGAPDLFQKSYLIRNEIYNNYPSLSIWSTIFPWLASDLSFFSLPLIMMVISYKFSFIWNKTVRTGNPYGYLLLGQFFIFWFMVPANNQLFHTFGNSVSFILILFLYLRSKRYYQKEM